MFDMIILYILLLIFCLVSIVIIKYLLSLTKREQSKKGRLEETAKMVDKILLNNRWGNIDKMIEIMKDQSIQNNFKLR